MVTLTAVYVEQSQAKEQVLEGRVHFCSGKPELNGFGGSHRRFASQDPGGSHQLGASLEAELSFVLRVF